MTVSIEQQHRIRYEQARKAIWENPRARKVTSDDIELEDVPVAPKPAPRLVWFLQFNEHVIAFRRWQLSKEMGRAYVPRSELQDVKSIIRSVLEKYPDVTFEEVMGPRRLRKLIEPRQRSMYEVARLRPDLSYPALGRIFRDRDHSTIIHAVRKMSAIYGEVR